MTPPFAGGGTGSVPEVQRVRFRCGIDIGGTFTDFVLVSSTGETFVAKTLTTYPSPVDGVISGLVEMLPDGRLDAIEQVVHGTTLAANLILERKGARTGLLTTKGFRDVLEMRRGNRVLYDLFFNFPPPLVPRDLRVEVDERLLASGDVLRPLDRESLLDAHRRIEATGIEAIAICFLHSYKNPMHEREARQLLNDTGCALPITLSSDISGEMGEYERLSTAVVNAYLQPAMSTYLRELAERLAEKGFRGSFYMMLSHGGIAPRATAEHYPVRVIESGPAAGMIASAELAARMTLERAIGFDMGGTTAKVCLVPTSGIPLRATFEVCQEHKLERGTGYSLNVPSVDLTEIGAGGGSIAWIDRLGLLQVGPESAGADPGPACYGVGGVSPTVTDADLVLGLLNADYFLGGRMRLSKERAERAIRERLAAPLGLSVVDAARAVHDVVNENMARAIRLHALNRGEEPARYALIAFGGAAPVHASQLAEKLGIAKIVVPKLAGVQSAEGLLTAPLSITVAASFTEVVRDGIARRVAGEVAILGDRAVGLLGSKYRHELTIFADMRYAGQSHHVNVPLQADRLETEGAEGLRSRFEREYQHYFMRTNRDVDVEIVALNVRVTISMPKPHLIELAEAPMPKPLGSRTINLPAHAPLVAQVYRRDALGVGGAIDGPAVIEDVNTTIVVGPAARADVDLSGSVIIRMNV